MKINLLFGLILFFCIKVSAQKTLVLQPGPEDGKDAPISWIESDAYGGDWQNLNYSNSKYIRASAWTWGGYSGFGRFLIEFDLSSIPPKSEIISAKLTLFHDGSSETQSPLSGSNEVVIHRITEPWDETLVTWNNQPKYTDEGSVIIPATIEDKQNIERIDVTKLVADVVQHENNFGFMFKLVTEEQYRRMHFASSDNPNFNLRPKLEITYNEPIDTCFVTVFDTVKVIVYDTIKIEKIETITSVQRNSLNG
jgi:hypothetical protein